MGGEKVRGHNGKDKKGGQNIKQSSVNFKRPKNCVGFVFRVEIFSKQLPVLRAIHFRLCLQN